jgi:hypothetical protein
MEKLTNELKLLEVRWWARKRERRKIRKKATNIRMKIKWTISLSRGGRKCF